MFCLHLLARTVAHLLARTVPGIPIESQSFARGPRGPRYRRLDVKGGTGAARAVWVVCLNRPFVSMNHPNPGGFGASVPFLAALCR